MDEKSYVAGSNAAWLAIMKEALSHIGAEGSAERWRVERLETVALLRRLCVDGGDNDWPDDLHLVDVIEKHLAR